MLDVRKPLGLLFMILGGLLFLYGVFFSPGVEFHTPGTAFLLKLNQPVGAFMFAFGLIMWQLARFIELHTLDRELTNREKELISESKPGEPEVAEEGAAAGSFPRVTESDAKTAAVEGETSTDSSIPESIENKLDVTQDLTDADLRVKLEGEMTASEMSAEAKSARQSLRSDVDPAANESSALSPKAESTEAESDSEEPPAKDQSADEKKDVDSDKRE